MVAEQSLLPRFWQTFMYTEVPTTDATTSGQPASHLPRLRDILKSKRIRIIGLILLPSLLFLLYWRHAPSDLSEWHLSMPLTSPEQESGQASGQDSGQESKTPSTTSTSSPSPLNTDIDWSRFAYTQYVTNLDYLCNSVMLFELLHRLESKADRLMMYPTRFDPENKPNSTEGRLLLKARDEYGVKLSAIEVQHKDEGDRTWADSYTKLLAFNQTQYDRVLNLDSDSTIQQTMDELFLLPACPVAMPRAYWLEDKSLSSQLVLIQPSAMEFTRIMDAIATPNIGFDMEIVNVLYGQSAIVLPHRPYNILSGEFRNENHEKYMGNNVEQWDPEVQLKEAKFLHFSDWPMPKPWIFAGAVKEERKPKCFLDPATGKETDCRARDLWLGFYSDFARRRKEICDMDLSRG